MKNREKSRQPELLTVFAKKEPYAKQHNENIPTLSETIIYLTYFNFIIDK